MLRPTHFVRWGHPIWWVSFAGLQISIWYASLRSFLSLFNLCRLDGKSGSLEIKFRFCDETTFGFSASEVSFGFAASSSNVPYGRCICSTITCISKAGKSVSLDIKFRFRDETTFGFSASGTSFGFAACNVSNGRCISFSTNFVSNSYCGPFPSKKVLCSLSSDKFMPCRRTLVQSLHLRGRIRTRPQSKAKSLAFTY